LKELARKAMNANNPRKTPITVENTPGVKPGAPV
jgi:hypothetical protein